MLAKKYKLTRKDINFLFRKQKIIPWKYFSFFIWPQRPNRFYNQFSFQIPLKVTKSSVKRNFVKRVVYNFIKDNNLHLKKIWWNFYKIFIVTNKKTINKLKEIVGLNDKVEKKKHIVILLKKSFNSLKKLEDEDFMKNFFNLQNVKTKKTANRN